MKVYEFGKEHTKSFVMFQCAAEPWWVFKASADEMAKDYHVYLMIADGHDELGTEFASLDLSADHFERIQGTCPCGARDDVPGTVCRRSQKISGGMKMGLFKSFVSQMRKPEGFLGTMMLSGMNSGHAKMSDWGFSHLADIAPEKAVDYGACEEISGEPQ